MLVTRTGEKLGGTFALTRSVPSTSVHSAEIRLTITGGSGRLATAAGMLRMTTTLTPLKAPTPDSPFIVERVDADLRGHLRF